MKTQPRVLKVGIATREEMKARTLAVARGQYKPKSGEPKVWFTSIESLAQVLSTKNMLLLEMIAQMRPASMKELAEISGRQKSNLSRTLHTMERYGLVKLERGERGRVAPQVIYDRVAFDVSLQGAAA